jgi:hypothetical protein
MEKHAGDRPEGYFYTYKWNIPLKK